MGSEMCIRDRLELRKDIHDIFQSPNVRCVCLPCSGENRLEIVRDGVISCVLHGNKAYDTEGGISRTEVLYTRAVWAFAGRGEHTSRGALATKSSAAASSLNLPMLTTFSFAMPTCQKKKRSQTLGHGHLRPRAHHRWPPEI